MPIKGMTQAEIDTATAKVVAAGGKSVGANIDNRLPGETRQEANARIAAGYKAQTKPELTQEGKAAKAEIKFVRTETGGIGTFKEIFPMGTPIPTERTTEYGNTYDANGKLISGTGLQTGVPKTATTVTRTSDQQEAYNNAKALAQSFVDSYGGKLSNYFDVTTGKVTKPSADVINKKFAGATGKKEVSRKANNDGTFTVTYSDGSTEIIGTPTIINSNNNDATNAALQKQINDLTAQAAASKLAYDTAAQDKADAIKEKRVDAYQILKTEFEKYGLGSLVESVEALILNGTPRSEAVLKLRATPQYQLRFAGNTNRLAAGKNLYDESTYLALENDFQSSFEAYGQKALLGKTRESAQAMFAEYIGSDKSPTEIKDRIRLAVDEVNNRKDIRSEFQKFFPEITDSDLVSYFLKPKETLSALNSKVRIAQIGSAASAQGLNANLTTATDLEQLGLTEQQARTGYQRVATDLPTIEKLGDIDKTDIGQTTAENAYLKGLASEQRKIDKAAERERNRYAQSFGVNKTSLTSAKTTGQY